MAATVVLVADPGDEPLNGRVRAAARAEGVDLVEVAPAEVARALAGGEGGAVGVAAIGAAGEAAVAAAADDGRVAALALVGAPLSVAAMSLIEQWPEVAVLTLADPADRPALAGAVDAYLASEHTASDVIIGPLDEAAAAVAARWLAARLTSVAAVDEVVLTTDDGWEVHGTRWLPDATGSVPGVVLLHSGRSDRTVFARLERLLAERGMAVLNIDWRGRGRTKNQGTYASLSPQARADGWRDAAAALEHLAALDGVDAARLGAVGVVHGAEHATRAAMRDPRVRALVILTGYRPADDAEQRYLTAGAVDALYVTSRDHTITTAAMRALHDATPRGHSRYVEYPGGAIGYQLFEVDPSLEPAIVDWLADALHPSRLPS
jgi:dienelactone hydrolase